MDSTKTDFGDGSWIKLGLLKYYVQNTLTTVATLPFHLLQSWS
jgi:hypothetical protein